MIGLGINTSAKVGTVALTKDQAVIGELTLEMEDSYLRNILAMINSMLKKTHLAIKDIDLFTVVLGPGSWSGVRIGVATAKSLAHALNKPIVGVSTLDVLAYNLRYTNKVVYPGINAKNRHILFAGYDCTGASPKRFTDYTLASVEEFLGKLRAPSVLLLDDTLRKRPELSGHNDAITIGSSFLSQIRGAFVNEAGHHRFVSSGPDDTFTLAPLYLQETEAETNWALKHNR